MHSRHPLPVTLILFVSGSLGSVSAQTIDLADAWRFQPGDDPAWSQTEYDDSRWTTITAGKPWEQQGYADHDGFGWYRKRITIPARLRDQSRYRLSGSLWLSLDRIDDVDSTWINGRRVGGTGSFPPDYVSARRARRSYSVPGTWIRWDQTNLIAVRVYDGQNAGGLIGTRLKLRAATLREVVPFEWDLRGGNGLYTDPGPITFRGKLRNGSPHALDGQLHWNVQNDEGQSVSTGSQPLTLPAGVSQPIDHVFQPPAPGFYKVGCEFRSPDNKVKLAFSKFVGHQPQAIIAPLTREPDFDAFWKQTLESLAEVQPEFSSTRRSDLDTDQHEVYEVSMRSLRNVRVRGWYEKPKQAGSYPALLRLPGYGQNMRPSGGRAPIAVFSFNVRGHGNSQDDVPGKPANYWIRGLDDKQGYYYQGVYADCIRAVDFLVSRSEVDQKRIGVTGASQGGGLSLATAALDKRISLCAADIPFLCDWVKYFKASHWPEMDKWIAEKPERTWKSTLRTLSYFDTLNLADRVRCPVLLSLGVQDGVCPPSTVFAVYNRLEHRKQLRTYPDTGHAIPATQRTLRTDWIAREFTAQLRD